MLDTIGGEVLNRSLTVVKPGGTVVSLLEVPSQERAQALGIESLIEREREIVIRPVPTAGLEHRLVSRLGRAVKLTAHSIRIRLPDLTIAWRDAIDVVLDAVESTQSADGTLREPAVLTAG